MQEQGARPGGGCEEVLVRRKRRSRSRSRRRRSSRRRSSRRRSRSRMRRGSKKLLQKSTPTGKAEETC